MTPEAQLALIAIVPGLLAAAVSALGLWVTMKNNDAIAAAKIALDETKLVVSDTRTKVAATQQQMSETHEQVTATTNKLDEVGHQIDGKMDEIKNFTRELGNAAGRVEGTAIERDRIAVETAAKNAAVVAAIEGKITVEPTERNAPATKDAVPEPAPMSEPAPELSGGDELT